MCRICDFNAFELMTGCWRSKQASGGAPNTLNSDFQMFSSEAAYFDRSWLGVLQLRRLHRQG